MEESGDKNKNVSPYVYTYVVYTRNTCNLYIFQLQCDICRNVEDSDDHKASEIHKFNFVLWNFNNRRYKK